MEIILNEKQYGYLTIGLYTDIAPQTCQNFIQLSLNVNDVGYQGTRFFRCPEKEFLQGGDITNNDGTGGFSIYGTFFDDEPNEIKIEKYLLCMAKRESHCNSSQFFITTADNSYMIGKYFPFGQIIQDDSFQILQLLDKLRVEADGLIVDKLYIGKCELIDNQQQKQEDVQKQEQLNLD